MAKWWTRIFDRDRVGTDAPPLDQPQTEGWKDQVQRQSASFSQIMENAREEFSYYYRWLNDLSGGFLSAMRRALETFSEARASEAAASLAYYSLFHCSHCCWQWSSSPASSSRGK